MQLQLVPRLRMSGAVPLLLYTLSWHGWENFYHEYVFALNEDLWAQAVLNYISIVSSEYNTVTSSLIPSNSTSIVTI
jgi:hypothetical protein